MNSVTKRAIDKWGADAQMDQCIEECAERIVALRHYRRGKCDAAQVVGEIADVTVMLSQMALVFGGEGVVHAAFAEKFAALAEKVGGGDAV